MSDAYEVYAIKYAHHDRRSGENFIDGDVHDNPMPLDYFVWVVRSPSRTFVVDTGFDEDMAKRRGRRVTNSVEAGLERVGIPAKSVDDVILTHMHYDHAGNLPLFPNARFHVQDREVNFCTGRCMTHEPLRHAFEPQHVKALIDRVFARSVVFHDGVDELAPGLSVHWVGGHTAGLQVVRARTARGWMVLASDASHFYANMQQQRPYPIVLNVAEMMEGFRTVRMLADTDDAVIPGHDPAVLSRYPAFGSDTSGWIARLDADLT